MKPEQIDTLLPAARNSILATQSASRATSEFTMPKLSTLVQRFERNDRGRDLIVGDVHGHFSKLQANLDRLCFDPEAGDRLFCVGDLVDRGPENSVALDWLDLPWFHSVQGNHELMALLYARGEQDEVEYAQNGGLWNIQNTPEQRSEIARRFAKLPIAIELETASGRVGIVHADCPTYAWFDFIRALDSDATDHETREALIDAALWSRDRCIAVCEDGVEGVYAVVVGHTPVERYVALGNVIYIDTGAWMPGEARDFCILDAATLYPINHHLEQQPA